MARNLLTERAVANAKPKAKPYHLLDGDRLYLWVSPTGAKSWHFIYKLDGKEPTYTLGKVKNMTLAEARVEAEWARRTVAAGKHPKDVKRAEHAKALAASGQTFDIVAAAWVKSESRRKRWSEAYVAEVEQSLRNHLSGLNGLPISNVVASVTAPILHAVEVNAPAMEEKVVPRLNAIMDYAVEIGVLVQNPLPRRRRTKREPKHYPAVTDLAGLGSILRDARAADPCKGIARAHILLTFTALRVSEAVGAKWEEFALDGVEVPIGDTHRFKFDPTAGNWSIPRERMKRKEERRGPHVVPLPPQLLATLREWHKADGAAGTYVCPAPRDPKKSITPEGCEKFYRDALKLQGKHSPHSWRSAFSTVCREAGKDADSIEAQLDHVVGNKVSSAYDRSQRLALRRELMAWYEATLIAARDGANVLPIRRKPRT